MFAMLFWGTAAGAVEFSIADGFPIVRPQLLSLPLRDDQSVDDVIVSPDGSSIVYTIVDWERVSTNTVQTSNSHLYSASTIDYTSTRIDHPSLDLREAGRGTISPILISSDSRYVFFNGILESGGAGVYRGVVDGSDTIRLVDLNHLSREAHWLSLTPDDQWLVYQEPNGIYSVPTSGGPATRLNAPLGPEEFTSHIYQSPASSRVLFFGGTSGDIGGTLWSVNPNGSDLVALSGPYSLTPDVLVRGNSVRMATDTNYAFFQGPDSPNDHDLFDDPIYIVPVVGGVPRLLDVPTGSETNLSPTVTPDGRHVVYRSYRDRFEPFDLYSTPIEGGVPVRINHPLGDAERLGTFPQFSKDGSTIYYDVQGAMAGLFRASVDGSDVTRLNSPVAPGGGFIRTYALSPDESVIAYSEDDDGDGVHDLFLARTEGSLPIRVNLPLPSFADVTAVRFSDDGRWLLYHADAFVDNKIQPFLTRINLNSEGFGLASSPQIPIGVDATRSTFASFLPRNQVMLRVGTVVDKSDLYILRIPEPSAGSLVLLTLLGCAGARRILRCSSR